MANSAQGKKVLFICLGEYCTVKIWLHLVSMCGGKTGGVDVTQQGNICRSPIAEAVFNHILEEQGLAGWEVDSGAIGSWHVGRGPDRRAVSTMKKHNVHMSHKARQLKKTDFNHYDYIFGMDHENISDIKDMAPKTYTASIELFGSYDPQKELLIRDPYYVSPAGLLPHLGLTWHLPHPPFWLPPPPHLLPAPSWLSSPSFSALCETADDVGFSCIHSFFLATFLSFLCFILS
ncbi:low molecular weight phosphotyrosine protein phosphatase-like isoform X2 [Scylla paramamosain]|uniref:low molecular weight phosphotyrosine protein phosphatase-like isoform X2 n=1 Tax=Scylla paramamosain TaxID=85552 RepID=UPI003082BEA2